MTSNRSARVALGGGAIVLLAAVLWAGVCAAPAAAHRDGYLPADDDTVLAHVPAAGSELRALRAAAVAAPGDADAAIALATRYVEQARATSDPRWLGRAQAVLAPWWDLGDAPIPVIVLRATIRQSNHDFAGALGDLDRALVRRPDDVQAQLTRAVILGVQADYAAARAACAEVARRTRALVAIACTAAIDGVTGQAGPASQRLSEALARARHEDPLVRAWVVGLLAEAAQRRGDVVTAERHLRDALAASPGDGFLEAALADLLLDAGRPAEVIALLADRVDADGLLLRLAEAEVASHAPLAAAHVATLRDRFDAARLRGDRVHLREESRFALRLEHESRAALALALADWQVQREPADARVVLEAAVAAGDPGAARLVLAWLDTTGDEDPALRALAARLRGPR